jgi:hypothetical protein
VGNGPRRIFFFLPEMKSFSILTMNTYFCESLKSDFEKRCESSADGSFDIPYALGFMGI